MSEHERIERNYNATRSPRVVLGERVSVETYPWPDLMLDGPLQLEADCERQMSSMAVGDVLHDTIKAGPRLVALRYERTLDGLSVTEGHEVAE